MVHCRYVYSACLIHIYPHLMTPDGVISIGRHAHGTHDKIITSLLCQTTARRRFDAIIALLLRRVSARLCQPRFVPTM